jgi:hypothetical protein
MWHQHLTWEYGSKEFASFLSLVANVQHLDQDINLLGSNIVYNQA